MSFPEPGPNKRRKADASSSNRTKATTSRQVVAEVIGPDPDLLRCPICTHFPRREVYVCTTGHSVCTSCLHKLDKKCPTCQAPFQQTRNYFAERALDSMKFKCSWEKYGCKVPPMERIKWTSHETQCKYNPNSIAFCSIANQSCDYKLCPLSLEDPVGINVFLDHMKLRHNFDVQDVNLGDVFLNQWNTETDPGLWAGTRILEKPMLLQPIFRLKSAQGRVQLYMIFLHFLKINNQNTVLMKLTRLTEANDEKASLFLSLKGPAKKGPKVPDIYWVVLPEEIKQLKDSSNQEDDLSSYYMIPLACIQNYITEDGLVVEGVWRQ